MGCNIKTEVKAIMMTETLWNKIRYFSVQYTWFDNVVDKILSNLHSACTNN